MAGRKPLPTHLKILRGNPGRRPLPENEPEVPVGVPDPPKHLVGKAKKEWERIIPLLHQSGLVTKIDGSLLATHCEYVAQAAEASRKLRKTGMLIKGPDGQPTINPYWKILMAALDGIKKTAVEFGMSPSSRSRVKATPKLKENEEGEDYFGWVEEKCQ